MKKTMRVISAAGLGLLTGLAIAAGPAQAAGATAQSDSKAGTQQGLGRDDIVGFFRSPAVCEVAGHLGERSGRWDDYYCEFAHIGFGRVGWVLRAECDREWRSHGHHKPGKPHSVKGDNGYGGKPQGAKDDDNGYGGKPQDAQKDDAGAKPQAAPADDGYGSKPQGAQKDEGKY